MSFLSTLDYVQGWTIESENYYRFYLKVIHVRQYCPMGDDYADITDLNIYIKYTELVI